MRCYLSGKISGTSDFKERFEKAARTVMEKLNCEVVNPVLLADNLDAARGAEKPYMLEKEEYMKADLVALLTAADAIVMMSGYEESEGSRLELAVAKAIGHKVFFLNMENEELLVHDAEALVTFPFKVFKSLKAKGLRQGGQNG